MEETVTIVAEATPLQTNTGQVAKTIDSRQIQDLMLNGRNPSTSPFSSRACAATAR